MREVVRVVQAICDLIPTGGLRAADMNLFTTLLRWREQAAARLQEIMAALQAGDEARALQLSEMEPRLPDFIAYLGLMSYMGLSEEKNWKEYFLQHGIPLPLPLDATAVQRLHDLYMRGITPDSSFYREYVAAIKAGDEDRALNLLRSIVRLTRDPDAKAQFDHLLRKKVTPQLAALHECLNRGQEDGVLAWLDEFEISGAEAILIGDPVFAAATAASRDIMSRRSTLQATNDLADAVTQAGKGNWTHVHAAVVRMKRLHADWGISLDPTQIATLQILEKHISEFRAESERRTKFDQGLAILRDQAARTHQVLYDGRRLTSLAIYKMQDSLSELQATVQTFGYPIPQEDQDKLHEIARMLHRRLEEAERARKLRSTALYVPLAMLVGGMLWLGYLFTHAQSQLTELDELRAARSASAANRLLAMMMKSTSVWMLNLSDATKARLEALRKWALMEQGLMEKARSDLGEIELQLAAADDSLSPEVLNAMLDKVRKEMKQLAPDYLLELQSKFEGLQNRANERFRILFAKNMLKARDILASLQKLAAGLDFERAVTEIEGTISAMLPKLSEVASLDHPTVAAMSFPDEIKKAIASIRVKVELFAKELAAFAEVNKAMSEAMTVEAYKQSLIDCDKLRFKECRDAGLMLGALPSEVEMLARLTFDGDVNIWKKAVEQISGGYSFIPKSVTADETRDLKILCDDPNLNAPGSEKKLIAASGLRDAVSPAPGKPAVSLLKVMDNVIRSSDGDVLAKAYIFQELGRIMRARSTEWGLHFCPELLMQLNKFDTLIGKERIHSGDWNRPASRKKWQAPLGKFFASASEGKPFLESGAAFRDTVAIAAAEGVRVIGYVDGAREAHMKSKKEKHDVAWGFGEQGANLIAVEYASGTVPLAGLNGLRKWTPLLTVPRGIQPSVNIQAGR